MSRWSLLVSGISGTERDRLLTLFFGYLLISGDPTLLSRISVIHMDYGKMIRDSFEYAKDGLTKNPKTWIMLIVLTLLPVIPFILLVLLMGASLMAYTETDIPASLIATLIMGFVIAFVMALILGAFSMGYLLKILRGEVPLPEVTGFGTMFVDGIKLLVIEIIYLIPVLIILAVTAGAALISALPILMSMPAEPDFEALMPGLMPIIGGMIAGILIAVIAAIILWLLAVVGVVRFARTGKIGEAFNFSAILATIGKIRWGTYILALIIVVAIVAIVEVILSFIPYIGSLILILISPFIMVFMHRYVCILYDSAGNPADPSRSFTP
ncbi:MAG: hypothetical protein A4E36_00531 [Methanoregulaceae archaeon PtaB.Bin009]|nr:MAG: hypothetical protein A4E36_00531 [Methanoregulaceae archaeon PtaB.Bin009]OPY41477.1 MAG: hypothetical protein A4E41_00902 [Methanoregulaceae archaeon PtaU1.Bin066]